jgi:RNA polymerase sigma-70 factor (ECF subfamily)
MSTIHKLIKDTEKEWPSENEEAYFESLFHTYYKQLCRFAYRVVRDKDLAEDVVQSCFVNFWQKRTSIAIQSSFKTYLFRAVYNRSVNEYNRAKKTVHEDVAILNEVSGPISNNPILELEGKEMQDSINKAIAAMPDGCRTVFLLSREEQLSYKEIAEMLQISVKTVENHMGKALRIMREHLFVAFLTICLYEGIVNFFSLQ